MNNLPSLYQLSIEYQMLVNRLSNVDLDAQTIADTIESTGLIEDITTKGQNIIYVARSFEQDIEAIDGEIKRLQDLKKRRQATADRLREYLLTHMQATGIERITGPLMTISIRSNPPAVDVFEPGLVAEQYMRQPPAPPPAPDKALIKADLQRGMDVQGCRLTQAVRLVVT